MDFSILSQEPAGHAGVLRFRRNPPVTRVSDGFAETLRKAGSVRKESLRKGSHRIPREEVQRLRTERFFLGFA